MTSTALLGYVGISTHTLTWSVTVWLRVAHVEPAHFNSHAHVERDTPPTIYKTYVRYFNSHAHVERDVTAICKLRKLLISTHTLTWSVTNVSWQSSHTTLFQLTRSRGA